MIKLIEMECENCGGALEQIDKERARCPHCDAIYLIDRGEPKEIHIHHGVFFSKLNLKALKQNFIILYTCMLGRNFYIHGKRERE